MAREIVEMDSEMEMTEGRAGNVGEMLAERFESATSSSLSSSLKSSSKSTGSYQSALSAWPDVRITIHDDEEEEQKDQSQENFKRFVTMKEFFAGLTIVVATAMSALALHYPGESDHARKIKGYAIVHVAVVYWLGFMFTVNLDCGADGVHGIYYPRADGERKVLYEKIWVHLFGLLVFGVGLVSPISCLTTYDETFVYVISMMTIIMNGAYSLMKNYKSDKIVSVVVRRAGTKIRSILKPSRKHPPLGRLIHYEPDPSFRPFNMV